MASVFDKKRSTLPVTLQFPVPPHSEGIILNKQTVKILPSQSQTSYSAGQTLRFKIQDQKAVDLQSIALNFFLTTNVQQASVDDWIGSIIRTLTVSFNSYQIERIDRYNRLHAALSSFSVDEGYRQSLWGDMEGYYPRSNQCMGSVALNTDHKASGFRSVVQNGQFLTNAANIDTKTESPRENQDLIRRFSAVDNGAGPPVAVNADVAGIRDHRIAREYTIHFDLSGFLARHRKVFWIPLVNSIDIDILLEQNSEVMNQWNVETTNLSYTVDQPHLQAEMYTLSQEYVNALSLNMQEQGLTLSFDTYEVRQFDLALGTNHQVTMNTRLSSLKSMYLFFYQPHLTAATDPENKRIDKTWVQQRRLFSTNTLVSKLQTYQLFIDGRPIQAHPIQTKDAQYSEALWELMKSLRLHGDVSGTPNVCVDSYTDRGPRTNTVVGGEVAQFLADEHFMVGIDLEKSDLLSGHSVANQLYLDLTFDQSLGAGVRMYVVMHYDKNVIVYPGLTFEERI